MNDFFLLEAQLHLESHYHILPIMLIFLHIVIT